MGSLKCYTSPPRNPWWTQGGGGGEDTLLSGDQYEDCKAGFILHPYISDGVDYKGETKSPDTELLFIVHAQQM